jgi:hypothetical protein
MLANQGFVHGPKTLLELREDALLQEIDPGARMDGMSARVFPLRLSQASILRQALARSPGCVPGCTHTANTRANVCSMRGRR